MPRKSTDTIGGWYPGADPIGIPEGNYALGIDTPLAVVLHIIVGTLISAISEFTAPKKKSSHFGVGKNGSVKQFVSIKDTSFANGLSWNGTRKCWVDPDGNLLVSPHMPTWGLLHPPRNPNYYTITIEREGKPADVPTEAMDAATIALLQWLAGQLPAQLRPYRPLVNLIGHRHIAPIHRANCPGPHVDFTALAGRANAVENPLRAAQLPGIGRPIFCSEKTAQFYAAHGGLSFFGFPLSDERATTGADGQPCTILPCERAVLKTKATEPAHQALLKEIFERGWV